jgi:hypothetical protein
MNWIKFDEKDRSTWPPMCVDVLAEYYADYSMYSDLITKEKKIGSIYWDNEYKNSEWHETCGCGGYECESDHILPIWWTELPKPPKEGK